MALIKKPVTGMKDILPAEMEIRDYCISVIKKTYAEFGFQSIETPCVENIANLTSKQGGDNEKLIFKILKRGEKLKLESAKSEADLVDGGLRYDLTVPLVRYFSNHQNELPMPFKALQMGNVWRADRPQKGRYRQFMQCDIDIIGEPSWRLRRLWGIWALRISRSASTRDGSSRAWPLTADSRKTGIRMFSLSWIRWIRSVSRALRRNSSRRALQSR